MVDCERRVFSCGGVCLFTQDSGLASVRDRLRAENVTGDFGFAVVYFSKSTCRPRDVADLMQATCPGLDYAACSTAGEITPSGLVEGQVVVLLFPRSSFVVDALCVSTISGAGIESISSRVAVGKRAFLDRLSSAQSRSVFAMCLIDGMSYAEEAVTAAIHWGLDDIPLLGGSAGDDLNFSETSLILNGQIENDCAIILLVASDLPMRIFKTDNFIPTRSKLVVTRSDPARRIVHELNAAPAALEYANVIGTQQKSLSPQSFASHPLVVRVGGEYYCRSIQKVNDDGSLSFFCAIDDGIVLTVAEPTGMARTTRRAFEEAREALGEIDFVLGFDCVLRQIDARNRQATRRICEIYRENHVVGFNTYGEQYRSMHLNQTFTGVAFGHADGRAGS
ncbi:MAG: FIST N-terminal domain-containing protein [Pseudomonadota bacterium]